MGTDMTKQGKRCLICDGKAIDGRSYDAGLEMAAQICERPIKSVSDGIVYPPAPIHARQLRFLKVNALTRAQRDQS